MLRYLLACAAFLEDTRTRVDRLLPQTHSRNEPPRCQGRQEDRGGVREAGIEASFAAIPASHFFLLPFLCLLDVLGALAVRSSYFLSSPVNSTGWAAPRLAGV